MVQTVGLHPLHKRIPRFATSGRPKATEACYVAFRQLPRPDFHPQVIRTFQGISAQS